MHPLVGFSIYHFIFHGGFFMYLLLACSLVSVATIYLRATALKRETIIPPEVEAEIEALPVGDDPVALARLYTAVERSHSPFARIVYVSLRLEAFPKQENMEVVQARARQEVLQMESGLGVLEVIVGVAPLLGLLGAVSGLVTVFGELGSSSTVSDPRTIAAGISEALNTTIAGLGIAIPCLVAHSFFSRKVERLASEMELLVNELLIKRYSQSEETVTLQHAPEFPHIQAHLVGGEETAG